MSYAIGLVKRAMKMICLVMRREHNVQSQGTIWWKQPTVRMQNPVTKKIMMVAIPLVEWSGSEIVCLGSWVRFPPRGPVRPYW